MIGASHHFLRTLRKVQMSPSRVNLDLRLPMAGMVSCVIPVVLPPVGQPDESTSPDGKDAASGAQDWRLSLVAPCLGGPGFEDEHHRAVVGAGAVPQPVGYEDAFPGFQVHVPILGLNHGASFHDQEEFVLVFVGMPGEFVLDPDDAHNAIIDPRDVDR